jgi:hypothetical protein
MRPRKVHVNAIRIFRRLDSETVYLPELRDMIGKNVEIIVLEEPDIRQSTGDLSLLQEMAGTIDLDFEAIENLREISK